MTRYKLTIEYDGTPFVGWQWQDNGLSVQEVLEQAIEKLCGQKVKTYCAGRTDAGVHAKGQVAHFDLPQPFDVYRLRAGLNYYLKPHPIAVLRVEEKDENFHARFSAIERRYLYRIITRPAPLVLDKNLAWHITQNLNVQAMHEAAQILVGRHDFTTFRASSCQANSPIRTIDKLAVTQHYHEIQIIVHARSFLHHQVRNIVGSLKLVGEGKWTAQDIKTALVACDRKAGGPTAPAAGLYLTDVLYEDD